jgi:CubicO group peptidase (beta-lactamase class C family)
LWQPADPSAARRRPWLATIVVDDFEDGDLAGWMSVGAGAGGWFVYTDGSTAPDPSVSDPGAALAMPDPPEGTHAVVTDMNGPGTRILFRDLRLDGRFKLLLNVFYRGGAGFSSPATLAHDGPEANQQFRADLISPTAPIDSLASADGAQCVPHVGRRSDLRKPADVVVDVSALAGQTVRLRLAEADNQGRCASESTMCGSESTGSAGDTIEILETPEASTALELVLHRMSQSDALAALVARADKRLAADECRRRPHRPRRQDPAGAAWGLADREAGTPNSIATKFRIGSMNKMFTSIATLQPSTPEAALDEPIGTYPPDYPNEAIRPGCPFGTCSHTSGTVTSRPQFEANRLGCAHADYVALYGPWSAFGGVALEYSNYGFVLLGAVIEAVTGRPYYDVVRENVFGPAGMTATDSLPESERVPDRSAGYTRQSAAGRWLPNIDTLPWRGTSAGGGYSTVGDLMRFGEALRSGKLISAASLAEATRPQSAEPYGFGLQIRGEASLRNYGHGGGAPGMNGDLRIYPELGYVVVSLSNLDPPAASDLVEYFTARMPDA